MFSRDVAQIHVWFLIYNRNLYFGLYVYEEIHFLPLMLFEEHPKIFLSKLVISTRHVYILDRKKKRFMSFYSILLLTEVIICMRVFYFMSKCKNVFKALKMNTTKEAGKLK